VIQEDRCARALAYLAETDEKAAELKAQVARKEYGAKLARSKVFLVSEGSVEARKAMAETSQDVQQAEGELADSILEFEKVKAKRATEELIVDVWRSVSANRRQGNV
jgi:L-lactate utilization protein LutB